MARAPKMWAPGAPGYRAVVVTDSVTRWGCRLTTMVWTAPRFILAEINTHRDKERNSNSSRAVPVADVIRRHEGSWFVPEEFLENRAGMQGGAAIAGKHEAAAVREWMETCDRTVLCAKRLAGLVPTHVGWDEHGQPVYETLSVHKQYANRPMEAFMWHDMVVSGTHWANMFALRCHPAAQPQFQIVAGLARDAIRNSVPTLKEVGELHLPFVSADEEYEWPTDEALKRIATARCALISYRDPSYEHNVQKDFDRYNKLASGDPPHASAFGHVAEAMEGFYRDGPFWGWRQHRRDLPGETTPEVPYRGPAVNDRGEEVQIA